MTHANVSSTGNKRKKQTKNWRKFTWRWCKVNIGNVSEVSGSMTVMRRVRTAIIAKLAVL
jgi:hypothetical protein